MKKGQKLPYARVSTREQNLDLQLDALKEVGCDHILTDQSISDVAAEREGSGHAIEADSLGCSLGFLAESKAQFGKEGKNFIALQYGIDTTTNGGKLVFYIMASLAEFERNLVSERATAGMSAAKRRGKHIGQPVSLSRGQAKHTKRQISKGEETIAVMASVLGVHRNTLRRTNNSCRYA